MDSPQQCVPTHCFLRLEPSIVQATSFHQQLPHWMCLPLTHPSSLFSLRRDFSPPPDFRTVRNCPEPLSMRRRTAFLRQGCRILYIVGVCVNRIGTEESSVLYYVYDYFYDPWIFGRPAGFRARLGGLPRPRRRAAQPFLPRATG